VHALGQADERIQNEKKQNFGQVYRQEKRLNRGTID